MTQIQTYIRIRPFLRNQQYSEFRTQTIEPSQIKIKNETGNKYKHFKFNGVSNKKHTQKDFYDFAKINCLVDRVLQGYHSTVFAYGQTGSGKTYTMEGFDYTNTQNPKAIININDSNENLGIIPRALTYLFQRISKSTQKNHKVEASFLQIYNQKIYDLLDIESKQKQGGLKLRWNKYQQFVVDKLQSQSCQNIKDALTIYGKGVRNKIMCKHKLNLSSSRSHCVLIIKVQTFSHEDPTNILKSKFSFVDLAGSQRQQMTGTQGVHYKQAIEINKSLFTLRQVIMTLSQFHKNKKQSSKIQEAHIPYRDSKLTSILKQSIGGDGYCIMIACVNPGDIYIDQSLQTLTYAALASQISNIPLKNQDQKVKQIRKLQIQLKRIKADLASANEHIQKLTQLLQQKIISKQKQPQTIQIQLKTHKNSISKEIQTIKANDPVKQITYQMTSSIDKASQVKQVAQKTRSLSRRIQPSKNKQMIESMRMIKQLLNSNSLLRQTIQQLKSNNKKQASQLYELNKQNQVLRQRWDMVGGFINYEIEQKVQQQPKGEFYKLQELLDQRQDLLFKPYRIKTPSVKHTTTNILNSKTQIVQRYTQSTKKRSSSSVRKQTLKSLYSKLK